MNICSDPSVVKALVLSAGHTFFESEKAPYNLNIVGVRDRLAAFDTFGDVLTVTYRVGAIQACHQWPITTRPGYSYLRSPINKAGTAVLAPGQYRSAYAYGRHKGKPALVQVGAVRVYRDNNRDAKIDTDPNTIEEGFFGINIHRAGLLSKIVGLSSAGCQVFKRSADCDEFLDICNHAIPYWGNRFTYTLVEI